MPKSSIVNLQPHPVQSREDVHGPVRIAHHHALGNFELEPARIRFTGLNHVGELIREMRFLQAAGRQVHRDGDVEPGLAPAAALAQRLFEDEQCGAA